MKAHRYPLIRRLGCAAGLAACLGLVQAQALPRIGTATHAPAPTSATTAGLPSANGLNSRFPAGLPAPGSTPPGSAAIDASVAQPPVTGGGAVGATVMGAPAAVPVRYAAVDVARSFINADVNRDGELTRTEALRLAIVPKTFEDTDTNRDGVVTRFEYEDATR